MSEGNGTAAPETSGHAKNGNLVVGYGKPPIQHQFGQPGVDNRSGGVPRGTKQKPVRRLRNELLRLLQDHPEKKRAIVAGLVNGCIEGDAACQRIAWDRLDGVLEKKIDIRARAIAKVIVRGE